MCRIKAFKYLKAGSLLLSEHVIPIKSEGLKHQSRILGTGETRGKVNIQKDQPQYFLPMAKILKFHKLIHNFRGIMIAALKIYEFYMR